MFYVDCSQGSPCHPGVGCDLDGDNQPVCGDCPEGMTGDGLTCDPGMYDYITRHIIADIMMYSIYDILLVADRRFCKLINHVLP